MVSPSVTSLNPRKSRLPQTGHVPHVFRLGQCGAERGSRRRREHGLPVSALGVGRRTNGAVPEVLGRHDQLDAGANLGGRDDEKGGEGSENGMSDGRILLQLYIHIYNIYWSVNCNNKEIFKVGGEKEVSDRALEGHPPGGVKGGQTVNDCEHSRWTFFSFIR